LGGGGVLEGRVLEDGGLGIPIFSGSASGLVVNVREGAREDQKGWWLRVLTLSPVVVKRSAKSAGFRSAVIEYIE